VLGSAAVASAGVLSAGAFTAAARAVHPDAIRAAPQLTQAPPGSHWPAFPAALRACTQPGGQSQEALQHTALLGLYAAAELATSPQGVWALSSLVLFRFFGGRGWRLAPSSLRHTGAFAQGPGLPARGPSYATSAQRETLQALGQRYGCHTCGTRGSVQYNGDHIPPNFMAKRGQQQSFFPQCMDCSNLQGGTMTQGPAPRISHTLRLRLYHLWLPVGPFLTEFLDEGALAEDEGERHVRRRMQQHQQRRQQPFWGGTADGGSSDGGSSDGGGSDGASRPTAFWLTKLNDILWELRCAGAEAVKSLHQQLAALPAPADFGRGAGAAAGPRWEVATLPDREISRPWSDEEDEGLSIGALLKAFRHQLGMGEEDDTGALSSQRAAAASEGIVRATAEDLAQHAVAERGLRQRLAASYAHGLDADLREDDMAMAGVALRVAVRETAAAERAATGAYR
jgi:hypothetical protein